MTHHSPATSWPSVPAPCRIDGPFTSSPRPERGAHGRGEVAGGDDDAVAVDLYRQLRQGDGGRTEDRLGAIENVEGGLVARSDQLVAVRLVQAHGAPGVRAHAREREQRATRPQKHRLTVG